jgi:hypothetical protein
MWNPLLLLALFLSTLEFGLPQIASTGWSVEQIDRSYGRRIILLDKERGVKLIHSMGTLLIKFPELKTFVYNLRNRKYSEKDSAGAAKRLQLLEVHSGRGGQTVWRRAGRAVICGQACTCYRLYFLNSPGKAVYETWYADDIKIPEKLRLALPDLFARSKELPHSLILQQSNSSNHNDERSFDLKTVSCKCQKFADSEFNLPPGLTRVTNDAEVLFDDDIEINNLSTERHKPLLDSSKGVDR